MSQSTVDSELTGFATALIENAGGIMEWQPDANDAIAIVSEELAESLGQHEDSFLVTTQPGEKGLVLSLGGEFIDLAGRTLRHFIPAAGAFAVDDAPIRKTEFASIIESSFGWQNARAKVLQPHVMTVPYHAWWFHVTLHSQETWESVIQISLNATSRQPLELGELLQRGDLKPTKANMEFTAQSITTLSPALQLVEAEALHKASAFLQRIDSQRERDRKRLKDYYQAMLKESSSTRKRIQPPTPEELQSQQRAVKSELQRKLGELDERYQVNATLRPVVLAELHLPTMEVDVEIQRKSNKRVFRLYWNSVLKQMEPLGCSCCGQPSWNFWFTNDTVAPLCSTCHGTA